MAPEEVLKSKPQFISRKQQESYFDNGYLLIENAINSQTLSKLKDITAQAIDDSRQVVQSDTTWDLEPEHCSENPRLRRLTSPNDYDDTYWAYASSEAITEILSDLIGPDIKFHHSKLNFNGLAAAKKSNGTRISASGRTPITPHVRWAFTWKTAMTNKAP